MKPFTLLGAFIGMLVGLCICALFFRKSNTDGKLRTEYDERQKIVRGKAYKYGFYAMVYTLVIFFLLESGEIILPMHNTIKDFCIIMVGIMVVGVYSIWNGAYWGLNNNPRQYAILFTICTIINFAVSILAIARGSMYENNMLQAPFINLLAGVMFLIIAVTLFMKKYVDKKEGGE